MKIWCPFNEPLVSALFSGDFGFWPPHSRKWRGYMPVLSRIVQAVSRGIRAIRRAMPEATVLLCDAAENYKTRSAEAADRSAPPEPAPVPGDGPADRPRRPASPAVLAGSPATA